MRRALLLLMALAGCASSSDRREALTDALLDYTRGMRWSRPDWLKPYLPRAGRPSFDPTAGPAGLQLITCEIESVTLAADSQSAAVHVQLEWYVQDDPRLRSTVLQQTWRLADTRWEIVDQRTLRGAPFPPPPRPRAGRVSRR